MPNFDGVDVSGFQQTPNWTAFAAAYPNIEFVSAKATQGSTYTAPNYAYNIDALRKLVDKGWNSQRTLPNPPVLIPYHFITQATIASQTNHYANVVGSLRPFEAVMLDFEAVKDSRGQIVVPEMPVDFCVGLMNSIGSVMGRLVIAYRGYYYLGDADARYNAFPQWLPAYATNNPKSHRPYMIWQYGGGKVVGITPGQDVDLNQVMDYSALLSVSGAGNVPPPMATLTGFDMEFVGDPSEFTIGSDGIMLSSGQKTKVVTTTITSWTERIKMAEGLKANTPPSIALNADGRTEVFALGVDNQLYHVWETTPGSNKWSPLALLTPGALAGPPQANRAPTGELQVFAVGGFGNLVRVSQVTPGGTWGTWQSVT